MRRAAMAATGILMLAACEQAMMTETAEIDAGLPSPAQSSCMAAVANEAGDGNVTVLSAGPSQAGTEVIIGVGEARAPWRCLAANDGMVEEVSSLADESFL